MPKLGTNAFFFEEGTGDRYAGARYGEFRVAPDGEAILTGLRDGALTPPRPAVSPVASIPLRRNLLDSKGFLAAY
ncbi:MAG: GDYXXLXY domain-containing protein [Casimicrobiaceae bacterium]